MSHSLRDKKKVILNTTECFKNLNNNIHVSIRLAKSSVNNRNLRFVSLGLLPQKLSKDQRPQGKACQVTVLNELCPLPSNWLTLVLVLRGLMEK